MLVRQALVASPLVVSPETTLFELIDRILAGNQTTAAVVERDRLLGIVSAHDVMVPLVPSYLRMDARLAVVLHDAYFEEELQKLQRMRVCDRMQQVMDALPPDASIMEALVLFVGKGLKTVPVVEHGRFVGCVTRRSVLQLIRQSCSG